MRNTSDPKIEVTNTVVLGVLESATVLVTLWPEKESE